MALQGNIETFALPDVLQLLSSTGKTGRLRLRGDRGEGSVWVADGALVAGVTGDDDTGPIDALVALLRFDTGDFEFDQDERHDAPRDPVAVDAALGEARGLVDEWRSLEEIIPSADAWVTLRRELPGAEVTLDSSRWGVVVAVGGGIQVARLGQVLEQGELAVMRTVRDLHEVGVVEIATEAPAGAPAAPVEEVASPAEATPEPEPTPEPRSEEAAAADEPAGMPEFDYPADGADDVLPGPMTGTEGEDVPPLVSFEPAATSADGEPSLSLVDGGNDPFEPFDPAALVIDDDTPLETSSEAEAAEVDEDPPDAAEIARQLASLSPRAAKAVAAAAKATTDEEREEALRALDNEDTSLNRDLLLKFLGSVNS